MSTQMTLSQSKRTNAETTISISSVLRGKRYAWINHAGETYLLQLTKANKLLLTK